MSTQQIRVLPDTVINQIAAGEVVERPASVVRELVDNAVDAGADDISIHLADGGHSVIRIRDNGIGMDKGNALLAFERHATSKLSTLSDLNVISTMGFRGEALSSIASVSKVTLRTRRDEDESGIEVQIAGGKLATVKPVACPKGTEIEVRSLFFNTPARRKFLKSPRTEESRVKEWVLGSSLSRPGVRYRLTFEDKEIVNLPRVGSVLERGGAIYRGSTVSFQTKFDEVYVEGILAHPSMAQADTSHLVILVNSRVVSDKAVLRAIKDGFAPTLKAGEFPVGFVSITLPQETVDVNVNPQKSEVRFAFSQKVFLAVRTAVTEAVRDFRSPMEAMIVEGASPRVSASAWGGGASIPLAAPSYLTQEFSFQVQGGGDVVEEVREAHVDFERPQEQFRFSSLRYVGQIMNCYLLCELKERLYVVDMHAAHERYNYNLVRNSFDRKQIYSQQLLVPLTVQLSERGVQNCVGHGAMLERFGFETEALGDRALVVQAVPTVLQHGDIAGLIREIGTIPCDEISADGIVSLRIDHISARIACHASIRSGRSMER